MYPAFMCIGAQKAGTTWLHTNLEMHPQIWMPPEKELHYFDEKRYQTGGIRQRIRGTRAVDNRWRQQVRRQYRRHRHDGPAGISWTLRYLLGSPADHWYASLFPERNTVTAGEVTPNYSVLPPERIAPIADLIPDLKVILLLRNPLERAWSHAQMELVRSKPGKPSDEDFIEHFELPRSRNLTSYSRILDNWSAAYPEDQLFVGYLEDIHFWPTRFLASVCSFLGVDYPGSVVTAKVYEGGIRGFPTTLARALSQIYDDELTLLADRLGGHAAGWRTMAEVLSGDTLETLELAYPLWDSVLWDYVAPDGNAPRFNSGPAKGSVAS